jgi:chromatin segregation and condensation protein Rec8/ScpA/Scc1 (kleisin family)
MMSYVGLYQPSTDFVELDIHRPRYTGPQTTTELARSAIRQLSQADRSTLERTINVIRSKAISAEQLIDYLEEKVKFNTVIGEFAQGWPSKTRQGFAQAFQMEPDQLAEMDSIVSIAVLNDPDLESVLRMENKPEVTEADILENRRIAWQYPPPGTVLEPPYLVLVAVEHVDTAQIGEVVESIMGEITSYRGYKIPKTAAEKLGEPAREEFTRKEEVIEKVRETEPKDRTVEFTRSADMAEPATSHLMLRR